MLRNAIEKLAQAMLEPINYAAIILLGTFTVVWGIWLASPFWHVLSLSSTYSFMLQFGPNAISPEIFWGTIAIVCGMATIWGVLKSSYRSLIIGSSIMTWHWLMIAMFYFIGNWHDVSGITALCFSVYALFIYLNIKTNYRKSHSLND